MKTYLGLYLGAMLVTFLATKLVIALAGKWHLLDLPGVRKMHPRPVPRIGGIAIFLGMLGPLLAVLVLNNAIGDAFRESETRFLALLGCSAYICLVGLVDDIWKLTAWQKLMALITNAVNLIDGLDGLAAGVAAIACGVIVVFSYTTGQLVMTSLMLALLGSLSGFLVLSFNPARIFMGDSGSMFLGFMIAASGVYCSTKKATAIGLIMPALALGVPIFDMAVAVVRRFLERRGIMSADRGHVYCLPITTPSSRFVFPDPPKGGILFS